MAQLGAGFGSGYPAEIDSRQTFINGPSPAPDSNTRVDAEVLNDTLASLVQIETALGANPQGTHGSVAARLNTFLPGGGIAPAFVPFTNAQQLNIPGSVHRLGTGTILFQVYDSGIPAHAISPDEFTIIVNPANYDVTITFAQLQSGAVILSAAAPLYSTTFANVSSLSIPGSAHQLGTPHLLWAVYAGTNPIQFLQPDTLTVHPASFDVAFTFAQAETGTLILSAMGPRYVQSFTNQTTVTVSGPTHALGTQALLWAVWDNATPRGRVIPETVTVDVVNYTVTATFSASQSGFLVLAASQGSTGTDFTIQDAGIANTSAVRVRSQSGNLVLQTGLGNHLYVADRVGTLIADMDNAGNLGLGVVNPTYRLQLGSGDAAKFGSASWVVLSDDQVKEGMRPFEVGLATLRQLAPLVIWFQYNGQGGTRRDGHEHIGFSAQSIQPIAPFLVRSHRGQLTPDAPETEILDVDTHGLQFILIKALEELMVDHETLQSQYAALQLRVTALEAHMAASFPEPPEPEEPMP